MADIHTNNDFCFLLIFFDLCFRVVFFTALHGIQTRSSDENILSVCLSNARIVTKRKKDIYTIRKII